MWDYEDADGDGDGGAGVGAGAGDGKAGAGKGGAGDGVRTVPYDRFQATVAAKNEALAKVSALEAEVQKLSEKTATVDTLAAEVAKWKGEASNAQAKYMTHREIAAALGTTEPDVIEAAEWQFGRLPAKDRPKVGDWLTGLKAKPEDAPVILRPFLAPERGTTTERKPPPRVVGGGNNAGNETHFSAQELRAAREKAMATGDYSELRSMRPTWRAPDPDGKK